MGPVHTLLHTLCKSHGQPITACADDAKRAEVAEDLLRRIRDFVDVATVEEILPQLAFAELAASELAAARRELNPKCAEETLIGAIRNLQAHLSECGNVETLEQHLAAANAEIEWLRDAAEMLWVVLANVSCGDWRQQTPEWQTAAAQWRDNYFEALKSLTRRGDHMTQDAKPLTAPRYWCGDQDLMDRDDEHGGWVTVRDYELALATIDQQAAELSELANACHDLLHTHEHPPELTPMHSFSLAATRVYELASRVVEPRALAARSENA